VVRARWGDREAATLLAACDEATVRQLLPDLAYTVVNWTALAARFPQVVADHAISHVSSQTGPGVQRRWLQQGALVAALLQVRPEIVLDLAERHLTAGPLPPVLRQGLPKLLRVDPQRVVRLLLAHPDRARALARTRLSRRTCARLTRVPDTDLAALLIAADRDPLLTRQVLRAVAPSRRPAVFDATQDGVAAETAQLGEDLLALLPWRRRHSEARRMLALPHIAQDQERAWSLTASLPVAEAVPVLEQVAGSADADQRALGYRLLIRNAALGGDPDRVTDLLTWLVRMRNERDPVRQVVLAAVADLPYGLMTAAAVPALDRLVTETLNARDASSTSAAATARLAFRVLWLSGGRDDADAAQLSRWALATVERLGAWQSHAMVPGLDLVRVLRRGQEHQLWQPELQDMLADAMGVRNDAVLREAATLWLDCPTTRAEPRSRLPGLAHDPPHDPHHRAGRRRGPGGRADVRAGGRAARRARPRRVAGPHRPLRPPDPPR
jgi:hypothetical protein